MAYGDQKVRRSRGRNRSYSSSYSSRSYERKAALERKRARLARDAMLAGMSPDVRAAFLADEQAKQDAKVAEREARDAALKLERCERKQALIDDSRLAAGFLHTEIASAISHKNVYDRYDGDWLDDPVAAVTAGYGFGEEVSTSVGIKLQVNICLDCSNSMYYNKLTEVSTAAVRTMYMALKLAGDQLPEGSLVVNAWLWAKGQDGKGIRNLNTDWGSEFSDDNPLGPMANLPSSSGSIGWDGEDTWLHPLLQRLGDWEHYNGDAGAYRLDLIISDGMLEHKTDPAKGDKIQDRRDGNLQTIILNFLPVEDWGDYRVPNRCVQYPADADNLLALMRQIFGSWVATI